MPRIPLLHLLAIALCALALGAVPALAVAAPAPTAPAATAAVSDDEWDDEDDWDDDEDWGDEECAEDDEACWEEVDDLCYAATTDDDEWDDWSGAEAASEEEDWEDDWSDDEDWGDEDDWGDDEDLDDDWSDEECAGEDGSDDDAEGAAPPRLSKLTVKPVRRREVVRVSFRLDRGSRVTLALRRVKAASAGGRCTHGARAAKRRHGDKAGGRKARRCDRPRAVRGTTTVSGRTGANATMLRRWKGRRLEPGRYRLTATPAVAGGRGATATFTLSASGRRR